MMGWTGPDRFLEGKSEGGICIEGVCLVLSCSYAVLFILVSCVCSTSCLFSLFNETTSQEPETNEAKETSFCHDFLFFFWLLLFSLLSALLQNCRFCVCPFSRVLRLMNPLSLSLSLFLSFVGEYRLPPYTFIGAYFACLFVRCRC